MQHSSSGNVYDMDPRSQKQTPKRFVAWHFAALCIFALAYNVTDLDAATYYVATNGNNADNGSQGSPWQSIRYAAARVTAGDTVRVQPGTYDERIALITDGTSSAWINYVAEGQVICRGFDLNGVDYTRIIGFEITHVNTSYWRAITLNGACSHIEILDNYIHDVYGDVAIHGAVGSTPTYITIRGNTIYWPNHVSGSSSWNCSVAGIANSYLTPHHWLVEYNHIQRAGDFINIYGANHIIRNNFLHDFRNSYCTQSHGHIHSDMFQPGSDGAFTGTRDHVYERNFCGDSIEADSHVLLLQDTVRAGDTNVLFRGNVTFNIGDGTVGVISTDRVLTYNNTCYRMGLATNGRVFIWYDRGGDFSVGNLCANTIIYDDGLGTDAIFVEAGSSATLTNNLGYLAGTESSYLSTSDPRFVNGPSQNFRLQANSPATDAGTNLVWVTSASGTGTIFNVNDGQLLNDGWGMVEGDTITVGGTTTRITRVSGNSVTVANSVTWTNGTPVYWGTDTTPDIGALPYGSTELTGAILSQNGTTYTVTPAGDARGVWFYVDGIPAVWDSMAPFTANIPSGRVTAKAYALYASKTPVVVAAGGSAPPPPPNPTPTPPPNPTPTPPPNPTPTPPPNPTPTPPPNPTPTPPPNPTPTPPPNPTPTPTPGPIPNDLLSSTTWQEIPIGKSTDTFTWRFQATPNGANIDGVVTLATSGNIDAFADNAVLVRFNVAGNIDARNGADYDALVAYPYAAGTTYEFTVVVNVATGTYSVDVRPVGGSATRIATDWSFRTEQNGITDIDYMGWLSNPGSFRVQNVTIQAGAVSPPSPPTGLQIVP